MLAHVDAVRIRRRQENSFEGPLDGIGKMVWLTEVKLGKNRFSKIPAEVDKLVNVHTLDVHDNRCDPLCCPQPCCVGVCTLIRCV
jgi:hypothetical protein